MNKSFVNIVSFIEIIIFIWISFIDLASADYCVEKCTNTTSSDCSKVKGYSMIDCGVGDKNCYQCSSSDCCVQDNWYYEGDCDECTQEGTAAGYLVGTVILLCLCGCCIGCCR
eukprot:337903_1